MYTISVYMQHVVSYSNMYVLHVKHTEHVIYTSLYLSSGSILYLFSGSKTLMNTNAESRRNYMNIMDMRAGIPNASMIHCIGAPVPRNRR